MFTTRDLFNLNLHSKKHKIHGSILQYSDFVVEDYVHSLFKLLHFRTDDHNFLGGF